jgi:hypothetical protein
MAKKLRGGNIFRSRPPLKVPAGMFARSGTPTASVQETRRRHRPWQLRAGIARRLDHMQPMIMTGPGSDRNMLVQA